MRIRLPGSVAKNRRFRSSGVVMPLQTCRASASICAVSNMHAKKVRSGYRIRISLFFSVAILALVRSKATAISEKALSLSSTSTRLNLGPWILRQPSSPPETRRYFHYLFHFTPIASVLWMDEPARAHQWRFPPVVKAAFMACGVFY